MPLDNRITVQTNAHVLTRYCHNCASVQIGRQLQPASAMQPCRSYDIKTPLQCSSFSSDSVFMDLPAAWPYRALPVSLNNRPTLDDMVTVKACSRASEL